MTEKTEETQVKVIVYKDTTDGRYKVRYPDSSVDLINKAHNLSPLDNRYGGSVNEMRELFSDFNMTRAKVMVEVEYFKHLYEHRIGGFSVIKRGLVEDNMDRLNTVYVDFTDDDYYAIKNIEKSTHHDIKAIEYFVRDKFKKLDVEDRWLEYVHFGLTSQDVVSLANAKILSTCMEILGTRFTNFMKELNDFSKAHNDVIMVARTHGQPAIPTSIGREITVYTYRLQMMMDKIAAINIKCKFGGAIGNMAAHYDSFPDVNWSKILEDFTKSMGVDRSYVTTQTDNYDSFCTVFDHMRGISNIMIDLCRDMWMYISRDYFSLKVSKEFVGSSTMPQKVNPVNFESAEGNFEIATMWYGFLSDKLRISRLQRDLTDSTVIRNLGLPFAHFQLAMKSIDRGFNMLEVNRSIIQEELDNSYFILAEALQTRLRKKGYTSAYDKIKEHFRGLNTMNREEYHKVLAKIEDIPYELREELIDMKPEDYYRG